MNFYRLNSTKSLPSNLRMGMPEILWIDGLDPIENPPMTGAEVLLTADPLQGIGGGSRALVERSPEGRLKCHFNLGRTIEQILLEEYHTGLEPTARDAPAIQLFIAAAMD